MTEHKNIYSALCAAQSEFGSVQKGSTNPAFKSRYADLADVASVVIPTLSSHGVAVLHYITGEADGMAMRTEFVHAASETRVSCDVPLMVDRQNMQGMKSATTYAKRIGLESLSGVAPEDDDGNAAAKNPPKEKLKDKPRQDTPPFNAPAAADRVKSKLRAAQTLADLQEAFVGEQETIAEIGAADAGLKAQIVALKDTRKGELNNDYLNGDGLPE